MPNSIGFVDDSTQLAHYEMLETIKDFVDTNGWTVLRYDNSGTDHEALFMAPGLSGTEEIYLGIKTYHSVANDYYNMVVAGMTGYVSANTFEAQPGFHRNAVCLHNQRIDYWLSMNGQRISMAFKVGTPVYETAYLGKMLPYATPSQYPYPVVVGGTLNDAPGTRFSDTAHTFYPRATGGILNMRFVDGVWKTPSCYPWTNSGNGQLTNQSLGQDYQLRPTDTNYPLIPIILHDNSTTGNVYGELDGVFFIPGFSNAVENTLTINAINYVVIQDVYRTGFNDYLAMRLDT